MFACVSALAGATHGTVTEEGLFYLFIDESVWWKAWAASVRLDCCFSAAKGFIYCFGFVLEELFVE